MIFFRDLLSLARPYLDLILDTGHHFILKLAFGLVWAIFLISSFFEQIFVTPDLWIGGLFMLVLLDFIVGNYRVWIDPEIQFCIRRWSKTVTVKAPTYIFACIAATIGANMFPLVLGPFQYVVFCVLAGREIYSILANLKLLDLARVFVNITKEKHGLENLTMHNLRSQTNQSASERLRKKNAEESP